ncbi:MAG: hypothetical protein ACRDKX_06555 [Solirubrobacterales bacterium]
MHARARPVLAALAVLASAIGAATAFAGESDPLKPEISGEPREGETLFASESAVGDEPEEWIWERCSNPDVADCEAPVSRGGSTWTPIPGASGPDEDSYLLGAADVDHFVRVVAGYDFFRGGDCSHSECVESDPVGPIAPALGPSPPPPGGELPPAVAHVSANLTPLQGTILVKLPGTDTFIPLTEATQVPLGTVVDATNGHVLVTTARNQQGEPQSGEFWAGVFKLTQNEGDPLVTRLKLVDANEPASRAQGRSKRHRLWGRGRCRCRSGGRHSSATVRGTWWLTEERRRGTFTRVKRGKVKVFDFGRPKFIRLGAGERYLARARRG